MLGVDLVLLFVSSALTATVPILITGGLASVILGPAWWLSVVRLLLPRNPSPPLGVA